MMFTLMMLIAQPPCQLLHWLRLCWRLLALRDELERRGVHAIPAPDTAGFRPRCEYTSTSQRCSSDVVVPLMLIMLIKQRSIKAVELSET